jgi:hypothetical protein
MYILKSKNKNHLGYPLKIHITGEDDKSLCGRVRADKNWKIKPSNDHIFDNATVLNIDYDEITDQYCKACIKIFINDNL